MSAHPGLGNKSEVAGLLAGARDLQKRIFFVLAVLVVYRIGTHIPIPGVDAGALLSYQEQLQQGLFGMFNMFSGGAFSRMAIFSLSVFPYITASIIMQLLAATSPQLSEMKKEGEAGRRKIAQYTRYLTVILAFTQGFGLASGISTQTVAMGGEVVPLVANPGLMFNLQTALTITAGTMFLMWLGEQINSRGVGNGISILIFAGIVATVPSTLLQMAELTNTGSMSGFMALGIAALLLATLAFIVFMETAQRRILVQYPKRQVGPMKIAGGDASHMPLKLNMAGVIPPIFASALLMAPITIASFSPNAEWAQLISAWFSPGRPLYAGVFGALIVFFCFFYTATVAFNTEETSDNLKQNGGFIPGIRPGKSTADYLDYVVTRITVIGAAYITFVCLVPEVLTSQSGILLQLGGTSMLIMVTVTIDTITRIQSYLIAQRYEGLLKKTAFGGRKKGRR